MVSSTPLCAICASARSCAAWAALAAASEPIAPGRVAAGCARSTTITRASGRAARVEDVMSDHARTASRRMPPAASAMPAVTDRTAITSTV